MPAVITNRLDLWTSASLDKSRGGRVSGGRQETYGIKKLRELVLELAVRGKLVGQDSNDEPAKLVLDRIAKEKARLVAPGNSARARPLPTISDEATPFEVPEKWEWVRLGDVGEVFNGNSISDSVKEARYSNVQDGLPFIATKDVGYGWQALDYDNGVSIPAGEANFKVAHQGAVFICCEGGSAGRKCGITERDVCFGNKLYAIESRAGVDPNYLLANYLTPTFFARFSEKMTGIIGGISLANFTNLLVPLPPIQEQFRIMAKVEELMDLADQLERQQAQSIRSHQTLVEGVLRPLTRVASTSELTQTWTRIASHFDALFTTEESINQLEEAILQLAVMGRLVPQEASDEDVRTLLARNDELRREVAELDRRSDVDPQSILAVEDRWAVPEKWTWRGLADLVLFVDYRGKTPAKQSSGVRLLTAKNVRKGQIDLSPEEFLSEQDYKSWMTRGLPRDGDVLFTTEAPLGNAAVVHLKERFALAQRIICFQGYGALDPEFLALQLLSSQFQKILEKNATGMTAKGIKASKLKQLPVAVPPLAEQCRIVAKVEELMGLCETLRARVAEASTTQMHLADAIVERAVA